MAVSAFWMSVSASLPSPQDVFDVLFDFSLDVCFFTNEEQAKISLRKGKLTLGRLPDSDLCLRRRQISRCHLMFFVQDRKVSFEVVGRGVSLNQTPVSRAELADNDVLTIGTVQIRVHINRPAALLFGS
jgi:pSer/pThr/pTyr-binding forkhead associated (FHA) protein